MGGRTIKKEMITRKIQPVVPSAGKQCLRVGFQLASPTRGLGLGGEHRTGARFFIIH